MDDRSDRVGMWVCMRSLRYTGVAVRLSAALSEISVWIERMQQVCVCAA